MLAFLSKDRILSKPFFPILCLILGLSQAVLIAYEGNAWSMQRARLNALLDQESYMSQLSEQNLPGLLHAETMDRLGLDASISEKASACSAFYLLGPKLPFSTLIEEFGAEDLTAEKADENTFNSTQKLHLKWGSTSLFPEFGYPSMLWLETNKNPHTEQLQRALNPRLQDSEALLQIGKNDLMVYRFAGWTTAQQLRKESMPEVLLISFDADAAQSAKDIIDDLKAQKEKVRQNESLEQRYGGQVYTPNPGADEVRADESQAQISPNYRPGQLALFRLDRVDDAKGLSLTLNRYISSSPLALHIWDFIPLVLLCFLLALRLYNKKRKAKA